MSLGTAGRRAGVAHTSLAWSVVHSAREGSRADGTAWGRGGCAHPTTHRERKRESAHGAAETHAQHRLRKQKQIKQMKQIKTITTTRRSDVSPSHRTFSHWVRRGGRTRTDTQRKKKKVGTTGKAWKTKQDTGRKENGYGSFSRCRRHGRPRGRGWCVGVVGCVTVKYSPHPVRGCGWMCVCLCSVPVPSSAHAHAHAHTQWGSAASAAYTNACLWVHTRSNKQKENCNSGKKEKQEKEKSRYTLRGRRGTFNSPRTPPSSLKIN